LRKQIPATTEKTTLASLPTTFVVNEKRLPVNLFTLRQTLYKKAKREPTFRFYSLYGLIARLDVLAAAWDLVADNDGAPGVDGVTIQQIAAAPGGGATLVATLHQELLTKQYTAQAVRRVFILKPNGQRRPLGIPTVRDRVVQAAARLILEPIFEADFSEASYGYRPGRQAHAALAAIERNVREGYTGIHGDLRCRPASPFRHDPARQADKVRRAASRRWSRPAPPAPVAGGTGGGSRRERSAEAEPTDSLTRGTRRDLGPYSTGCRWVAHS
jgi:hypothetical protein